MNRLFRKIFGYEGQAHPDPEILAKQLRRAYRDIYATDQGKLMIDDLCNQFYFLDPTYQGDKDDALFREGSRNVVLYVLGMMKAPDDNTIKEVVKL